MKPITLLFVLALVSLLACSSEADSPPEPPVNEFLVVGNDKGFRDDFINQANLVTLNDSSISVRSLRSADNIREYPLVNGFVEGGSDPALHWRFDTIGQDTIALTDTSRTSTFYLHRLRRVDSLPAALNLLTSGELSTGGGSMLNSHFQSSYVFNDMGQQAGCMISRTYYGYRDWTKMEGNTDANAMPEIEYYIRSNSQSSIWRLYNRFAQPILVFDSYKGGLTVIPLDSLSVNTDTLYGRSLSDRSFKLIEGRKFVRQDSSLRRLSPEILAELPATPDRVEVMSANIRNRHRRRWEKTEGIQEKLTIFEDELEGLHLDFSGPDKIELRNEHKTLLSTSYRYHDTAPYLIVGDECENDAYWHYALAGDSLQIRIPLRLELMVENEKPRVMEIDGKQVVLPVGRWYIDEEWRGSYHIGEIIGK